MEKITIYIDVEFKQEHHERIYWYGQLQEIPVTFANSKQLSMIGRKLDIKCTFPSSWKIFTYVEKSIKE